MKLCQNPWFCFYEIQPVYRLIESQTCVESLLNHINTMLLQFIVSPEEGLISQDKPSCSTPHTDLITCVPPWTTEERNQAFTENNLHWEKMTSFIKEERCRIFLLLCLPLRDWSYRWLPFTVRKIRLIRKDESSPHRHTQIFSSSTWCWLEIISAAGLHVTDTDRKTDSGEASLIVTLNWH